ncbi:MAG TPA: hypothetical protein VGK99_19065 [Acidobacteriota bacterium]
MKRLILPFVCLQTLLWLAASEPSTWNLASQQEFLRGTLRGVSLTSDGRITLAPAFNQKGETAQAYIFSMAQDRSGNVYLGTGNEGKIFKYSTEGKLSELAALKEIAVYALAADSSGKLYAASSPDGKVYEVLPDGKTKEVFDPKEKYIWSLAIDRQNNLFVGTGPRGIIFKVSPAGEGAQFFDSSETHINTLFSDGSDLYAGSAPGGYIYRLDSKGKPFVLYDSGLSEIKALTVDRTGMIYATAISAGEAPPRDSEEPKRAGPRIRVVAGAPANPSESDTAPTPASSSRSEDRRSAVYRISKDGIVETMLTSDEDLFYSVLVRNDGTVLAGSGKRGRIYSIDRNRSVTILLQAPEEQVTGLLEQGNHILAATSNLGKIFELSPGTTASGWYESDVLDARIPAKWGMIRWRVENATGANLEFFTRTGNTKQPDKTWSDWQGPYRSATGEHISSPTARYLQWKLQFPSSARGGTVVSTSNAVRSVSVTYLQQNVPPQITNIAVHPPGVAFQQFPAVSSAGSVVPGRSQSRSSPSPARTGRDGDAQTVRPLPRRIYQPGAQSFSWEAHDENGDELQYSLYFRAEGEANWKLLEEHFAETTYTLEGNALPDGVYAVKVVATDALSNPPEVALTDEMVSKTFIISSSPPRIQIKSSDGKGDVLEVRFEASSETTPLFQAEYSIDGADWRIVYPADGITDGLKEEYLVRAKATAGEHTVGVRVTDSVGNVGTAKVPVKN